MAAVRNPKDLFLTMLSQVRHGTERSANIYKELGEAAQNPEIKQALEARAFISRQNLEKVDEAFKLLGEKPVQLSGRLQDIFVEDFRNQLGEIQSPEARRLFVLAKANHLVHLRMAEYAALVAVADATGNRGVGVLLESCLSDIETFADRTKHLIHEIAVERLAARAAAS